VLQAVRELSAASDMLDAAVAQRLDIHRTDLRCLDYLGRSGPVSAGQLAEAVGLTAGALTTAVDRLVRAGYVRRRADAADRRRVVIQLTRRADRVVALFAGLAWAIDRLIDVYSDADLEHLTAFLRGTSEALSEHARLVSVTADMSRFRSRTPGRVTPTVPRSFRH
jgi:DNA-binding MarR family transcriptional regulator